MSYEAFLVLALRERHLRGDFYAGLLGTKITLPTHWPTGTPARRVKSAVEAELKRRGLNIRVTEGGFHVQDPYDFEVQMGGKKQ
jgi:hypothetical protein